MNQTFYKVGLGVCIFAGISAVMYYGLHRYDSYHNDKINDQARDMAYSRNDTGQQKSSNQSSDTESVLKSLKKTEQVSAVNFQELTKQNKDISAWLCIPGTGIDYPVVVSEKKDYYLRRDLKKKYSSHGTLYFAGTVEEYASQTNKLIYGHHMKDGSMFAGLMNYEDLGYAERFSKIYLYTQSEDFLYRVVGAFKTDLSEDNEKAFWYSQYLSIQTKQEWNEFLNYYNCCKLYDLQEPLEFGNHLLMLSTCEYSTQNGRLVVLCKQIGNVE